MSTIQIQIMAGPQRGRRLAFNKPPITFGREADNAIVVANPHASRQHGELLIEDGVWKVANHSPNGSRLNGKKIRKPVVLSNGDVVSIGDEEMFRVAIESGAAAGVAEAGPGDENEAPAEAEEVQHAKAPMLTGRTKLWIGIGVYMAAALALMVVLSTLKDDYGTEGLQAAPELTTQQIEREIRTLPPVESTNLQSQANEQLQRAREWAHRPDASIDARFRAHQAYQMALAYSGRTTFENPNDQLLAEKIQRELTQEVLNLYRQGYAQMNAEQYREAIDSFSKLVRMYPDAQSTIYRNAEQHRSNANRSIGKRAWR